MTGDLFGASDELPDGMQRALAKPAAPHIVAAFEISDRLARIFRPDGDSAGCGAVGDATRLLFGTEFDNATRRHFAALAGIRSDGPSVPMELTPRPEAVAAARVLCARHILRQWAQAERVLVGIVETEGRGNV